MASSPPHKIEAEQKLLNHILHPQIADDPLAFVMFAFPWGKKGTLLENHKGPRRWQVEELNAIKTFIQIGRQTIVGGDLPPVYQAAVAAGRGVGKSALVSWIVLWMMSTRPGSTTVVTANTEAQLSTKTWAELGRWHTMSVNAHWFERTALSLTPEPWYAKAVKDWKKVDTAYYYAKAQLWSKDNPDSFAGAHNELGELYLFDEASGIADAIWSITEAIYTERILDRYWFAFGNPRHNTGAFFECFHKHRDFWKHRQIDARTVEGTDPALYEKIISKYGADSIEARVEVYGQFPDTDANQFIGRSLVEAAAKRELNTDDYAGLIMGVDPARYGDDNTRIVFRRGRDARSIPSVKMRKASDTDKLHKCIELIDKYNPDAVCIDSGNGTAIIDGLKDLKYQGVHEIAFGGSSPAPEYANMRTYIWAEMRDWLGGGCVPDDQDLHNDLVGPNYSFQGQSDKIILEPKERMKARGLASPDFGDALACTFAVRVARRDTNAARRLSQRPGRVAKNVDYPMFG